MKREIEKRLEALEQRSNNTHPEGLGHFYALTDAEKARRLAHFYGEQPNGKS